MVIRKINAAPVINLRSNRIATFDASIKNVTLKMVTEIDFVTCGVEPRGKLFLRASKILLNSGKLKAKSYQRNNSLSEVTFRLIQSYVRQREIIFNPNRVDTEDWIIKVKVWKLMYCGSMQGSLRGAFEFKGQIEHAADNSEMYAVALEIIHEYETYCSHKVAIKKYVKAQRKIISSNHEMFFTILEKRDGKVCKVCPSVENLKIDHITPLSLGGLSVIENLQLLCGSHNSCKAGRPMEYLHERMKRGLS